LAQAVCSSIIITSPSSVSCALRSRRVMSSNSSPLYTEFSGAAGSNKSEDAAVKRARPASACPGGRRSASTSRLDSLPQSRPTSAHGWGRVRKTFEEKQQSLELFSRELAESLGERNEEGRERREAVEALQRSRCNPVTGQPWKNGGSCAGGVRSASLSRTRGSTTSGLFSDAPILEASEAAMKRSSQPLGQTLPEKIQEEGQMRRQQADAVQRGQRNLTGDPWRNSGACAGTVRTVSLSRTRGSTTSGLFSEPQTLAGSESAAVLRERWQEVQRGEATGQKRREAAEATRKNRCHSATGDSWKVAGACAGTVRSASLSRKNGSTCSGLFSDVQPLAGSDSLANLAAKAEKRMQRRLRSTESGNTSKEWINASASGSGTSSPDEITFSVPQPSRVEAGAWPHEVEAQPSVSSELEAEEPEALSNDVPAMRQPESASVELEALADNEEDTAQVWNEAELAKPCAGSGLAGVRAARDRGVVLGSFGGA